jgi:hypothetical protein
MTIISQDQLTLSRSFPGGYAKPWRLDPEFVVVGLVSLFGLCVSALALVSGASASFETIAPFLG